MFHEIGPILNTNPLFWGKIRHLERKDIGKYSEVFCNKGLQAVHVCQDCTDRILKKILKVILILLKLS